MLIYNEEVTFFNIERLESEGMNKRVLVALGGNAILQPGQRGTAVEQMANIDHTVKQLLDVVEEGYELVLTHGNGPQVGAILIQHEMAKDKIPPMTLDLCGAESQGLIGYMLCQSIRNECAGRGLKKDAVCLVTQVEVDPQDKAFRNPTKPVGPFYAQSEAELRMAERGERWIEDAGRGWRKVVPSPNPKKIVEKDVILALVEQGTLVVASGGGGIPVCRDQQGLLYGVEAVIDKDLAGECLAHDVRADIFVILTDVPNAILYYNTPDQKPLGKVSVEDMERYVEEGHFRAGSMGPKVEAALRFVKNGGERAIIARLDQVIAALKGEAGTQIIRS
jgi:carbamate kinase